MSFRVIIPARYESSRLPRKPLADIAGKPMIQHVYERALESGAETILIATDHEDIFKIAKKFGAQVCMTSKKHQSGTDRLSEAVTAMGYDKKDIIVNVQCDEPEINPLTIRQLADDMIKHENLNIVATLYEYINNIQDLFDPTVVKVVLNHRGYALYFSRSPIPCLSRTTKEIPPQEYLRHIGVYAYRAGFLEQYVAWEPSPLEKSESLEQLRILWNGGRVHLTRAKKPVPPGINTPEDLERVRARMIR